MKFRKSQLCKFSKMFQCFLVKNKILWYWTISNNNIIQFCSIFVISSSHFCRFNFFLTTFQTLSKLGNFRLIIWKRWQIAKKSISQSPNLDFSNVYALLLKAQTRTNFSYRDKQLTKFGTLEVAVIHTTHLP